MEYKDAGVDRDLADHLIEDLKSKISSTNRPEVESEVGDFGGFFRAPKHLKDPVFVATTDGVGTKLLLAEEAQAHRKIGQDLVAMCVNDLVACKAEPLVFLDYLATGKIDREQLNEVLLGIVDACRESNCSLIGGETAEMPGFYKPGRYDLAGFSVGAMERSDRMKRESVVAGDIIYGLPSSGFHSNGYSLVRRVLERQNWKLSDLRHGRSLGEALLEPTKLYVRQALELFRLVPVKAASHITGGGLIENLPRGFEESKVSAVIQRSRIPTSAVMRDFVGAAELSEVEAFSTWNMGIGFCVVVSQADRSKIPQGNWIELGHMELAGSHQKSVHLV
jgi:phosphoribosylformylglycinamidine cyclo-ligase